MSPVIKNAIHNPSPPEFRGRGQGEGGGRRILRAHPRSSAIVEIFAFGPAPLTPTLFPRPAGGEGDFV